VAAARIERGGELRAVVFATAFDLGERLDQFSPTGKEVPHGLPPGFQP
jgi:hypothetical protein